MKRYIILALILLTIIPITYGRDYLSDKEVPKFHIAEIYHDPDIIHERFNTNHSINVYGDLSNDVVYTFTIHSQSTLFMVNMIGSEIDETNMYLLYRPLGSTKDFRSKSIAICDSHLASKALADENKFALAFEEDLTQIPHYSSLLYDILEPGEYELYCEGAQGERIQNGNLATNIYLSPLGLEENCAIDLGAYKKDFHKALIAGTFSNGDVYYKFRLDSLNRMSIFHKGPLNLKPKIELRSEYSLFASSFDYPLKDDSIPQIKDYVCGKGEYYVRVLYGGDSIFGRAGLDITGVIDTTGKNWDKPFEIGSYSDNIYYTNVYSPIMFSDSSDGSAVCTVYHRFEIKDTMDLSISTPDYLNVITVYDNKHNAIKQQYREDYLTSLDVFNLLPGIYFLTTEGGYQNIKLTVSGKKAMCHLTEGKNYVATVNATINTPFIGDMNNPQYSSKKIQYVDAFGRVEQKVDFGVTPLLKDLISTTEFDRMYRDSCSWLSVVNAGAGAYLPLSPIRSLAQKEYNDSYTYEKMYYEDSPLNKLIEKYGPGKDWHTTGHSERTDYMSNTLQDSCNIFEVKGAKDSIVLIHKGFYGDRQLEVVKNADEDGHTTYVYTDKLGRQILSRTIDGTKKLDTYQVYDDFGNLCFVLPPMAIECIPSLGLEKAVDLYAYQYHYDKRNHFSQKKMPGAEWMDYVYDRKGRLREFRDEELKKQGKWKVHFYDRMQREVMIGIYKSAKKNIFSNSVDLDFGARHSLYGYVLDDLVKFDSLDVQKVIYYDDYDYKKTNSLFTEELDYEMNDDYGQRCEDDAEHLKLKGQQTGVMTRIIGTGQMLCKSIYYDFYQRPVQIRSINVNGRVDVQNMAYNFSGKVVASNNQVEKISYSKKNTFDHAGHLLTETHLINDVVTGTFMYNYDELGRIASIKRGNGTPSLTSTHHYNLRGWLTSIENPLFSQKLYYTDGIGTSYYNGNISSMNWKTYTDSDIRGYCFDYDLLSRLKNATYGEGEGLDRNINCFNEQITGYDKNGNILGLKRYGQTSANGYGLVDNLVITLNGNQLKSVNDDVSISTLGDNIEFKDGNKQNVEYTYDGNGNLIKDLNKKITNIEYNYLNLPDRIKFEDGGSISYLYDAAGTKLRVVHNIAGNTTTTDYCGNVIYENGTPKTLLTGAGFISLNDSKYHYYLQDHQGNNRIVASQDGTVEEMNHYYPFGGLFASTSSVQPYKYNGKELDRKGGLDWYDYGARMYDAALGRWHVVDPMAENNHSITPYGYCSNNPLNCIDPDGKQVIPVPLPYGPLPFYYPMTYPQTYNLPSDQQIMRHASAKFTELGQMITNTPKSSFAFGTLLYYQAKNAISPEYEHQRKRDRRSKEELDRNQANVAKSIDTNVSGMMPNGDPAPKRKPKGWSGAILKTGFVAAIIADYYNNTQKVFEDSSRRDSRDSEIEKNRNRKNDTFDIFEPIINKLDDRFWKIR